MWPSSQYTEKTYRFFKNIYDNYSPKKSASLKQHFSTVSDSSNGSVQLEPNQVKSVHSTGPLLTSTPSTFSSSTPLSEITQLSSASTSTDVFENLDRTSPPFKKSMTRWLKLGNHEVQSKFLMSRLSKIDEHLKEMHQFYVASDPISLPMWGTEYMSGTGTCQLATATTTSVSGCNSKHETFVDVTKLLTSQQRLPSTYDSKSIDEINRKEDLHHQVDSRNGIKTVVMNKLSSDDDVADHETGGITLCGGIEVGECNYSFKAIEGLCLCWCCFFLLLSLLSL